MFSLSFLFLWSVIGWLVLGLVVSILEFDHFPAVLNGKLTNVGFFHEFRGLFCYPLQKSWGYFVSFELNERESCRFLCFEWLKHQLAVSQVVQLVWILSQILITQTFDTLFCDVFIQELKNYSLVTDWVVRILQFLQLLPLVVHESLLVFFAHLLCSLVDSQQC